ncbi:MAG: LamG domain-containing protein [Phycisphaerales bacterium]|nr:LamG domain-containing protein [Phycisphaerales bacterium]
MRRTPGITPAASIACLAASSLAQPVAHWRFDESAGFTAYDSAGRYHALVVEPAAFVAGGIDGNCIAFPGGGYVQVGFALHFLGNTSFSLSSWVRTDPGYAAYGFVAGMNTATFEGGYHIAINSGSGFGMPNTAHFDATNTPGGEATGTTIVNDGQWHHIVAVHKASDSTRIYVDGAPVEDTGVSVPIFDSDAPFVVGGRKTPYGWVINQFTGMVDDLQIYNDALCDPEVEFLYRNPGAEILPTCPADFNADGDVNTLDVLAFLNAWVSGDPEAEANCDLVINTQDVLAFLNAWNAGC